MAEKKKHKKHIGFLIFIIIFVLVILSGFITITVMIKNKNKTANPYITYSYLGVHFNMGRIKAADEEVKPFTPLTNYQKAQGFYDFVDNGDGTASYSIDWLDYYDYINDEKGRISDYILSFITSGEAPSIRSGFYPNLTTVNLKVDKDSYSIFDIVPIYNFCADLYDYQVYRDNPDVDITDATITINIIDNSNGIQFDTIEYPKDLQKLSDALNGSK